MGDLAPALVQHTVHAQRWVVIAGVFEAVTKENAREHWDMER